MTDQKFYFDLDADGTADRISMLKSGSGFLALDKNGNGKIDDGSELFGTQSGDGFADLEEYDIDKTVGLMKRMRFLTNCVSGYGMKMAMTG